VEVDSKDESYRWLLEWLGSQSYAKNAAELNLITSYDSEHGNNPNNIRPKIILTPSVGNHFFRYRGSFVWMNRSRDSNITDLTNGGFIESIKITVFGKNRNFIKILIKDAMDLAFAKDEGKTVVYTNVHGSWGRTGSARAPRPMESVILPEQIKELVVSDIKGFLSNSKWYRDMGIPYRRGYLFHGYPGSGKTSFIYALAGYFKMNICIVNLSEKHMNDETLNQLLNSAPLRSVLVLEDIDAAYANRDSDSLNGITFSGLLNALDGIAAQEGRILFMTTNRMEVLDPALTRPGRVDVACHFGLATQHQVRQMFKRFYPKASEPKVLDFLKFVPNETCTMAELQGHLLKYRESYDDALNNIKSFLNALPAKNPRKLIAVDA